MFAGPKNLMGKIMAKNTPNPIVPLMAGLCFLAAATFIVLTIVGIQ